MYGRLLIKFIPFIFFVAFISSCIDSRKTTYFNDLKESSIKANNEPVDHIIEKNDLLSIRITSLSKEASEIFNTTNLGGGTTSNPSWTRNDATGYLVNADGNIQLPMIGNIKAEGSTKKQLKEQITKLLLDKQLLVDPIVDIRQLNYEVTITGEVAKPGVITVPTEKISMMKALAAAGDITTFGRKDNVLLIREENGKKTVKRLDLNSPSFLQSDAYYLQPNDVVYVEATKDKAANVSRNRTIVTTVISSISILVILIDRITR